MILSDMSAKRRIEAVRLATDMVMEGLTASCATADVCAKVARILHVSNDERPLLARVLVRHIAPLWVASGRVRKSNTTFQRYGREMRTYIWSPANHVESDHEKLAIGIANKPGVRRAGDYVAMQASLSTLGSFTCLACGRVRPAQEFHDLADRRCIDCPPLRTTQGLEDLL